MLLQSVDGILKSGNQALWNSLLQLPINSLLVCSTGSPVAQFSEVQ